MTKCAFDCNVIVLSLGEMSSTTLRSVGYPLHSRNYNMLGFRSACAYDQCAPIGHSGAYNSAPKSRPDEKPFREVLAPGPAKTHSGAEPEASGGLGAAFEKSTHKEWVYGSEVDSRAGRMGLPNSQRSNSKRQEAGSELGQSPSADASLAAHCRWARTAAQGSTLLVWDHRVHFSSIAHGPGVIHLSLNGLPEINDLATGDKNSATAETTSARSGDGLSRPFRIKPRH